MPSRKTARYQDRLDVATLEERDGHIFVVFHEAKQSSACLLSPPVHLRLFDEFIQSLGEALGLIGEPMPNLPVTEPTEAVIRRAPQSIC